MAITKRYKNDSKTLAFPFFLGESLLCWHIRGWSGLVWNEGKVIEICLVELSYPAFHSKLSSTNFHLVNLCNDSVVMINIWEGGYLVTDTQLNFTFRESDTP